MEIVSLNLTAKQNSCIFTALSYIYVLQPKMDFKYDHEMTRHGGEKY